MENLKKGLSGIYKIISPSGRIYIGQSVCLKSRLSYYKRKDRSKEQPRLKRSLEKYGYENHILEVVEFCDIELLNERERYWQEFYEVTGKNGLNCLLTKTSDKPLQHSEETKKKISDKIKGRKLSDSHKKAIGAAHKGKVLSAETKEKLSKSRIGKPAYNKGLPMLSHVKEKLRQANLGKKFSEERKKEMSKARTGEKSHWYGRTVKFSDESKKKLSEAKKGKYTGSDNVHSVSIFNTKTGETYVSIRDASEKLNVNYATLKSGLNRCVEKYNFLIKTKKDEQLDVIKS